MRRIANRITALTALLGVLVIEAEGNAQAPDHVAAIRAHMAFLADDLLEGREAGTRGEELAALYIASQFERLGLRPFFPDAQPDPRAYTLGTVPKSNIGALSLNDFVQPVPLRSASHDPDKAVFVLLSGKRRQRFRNGEDVLIYANADVAEVDVTAPLVFAGHGITAPSLGVDDYAGLDVAGKIAVVVGGPPKFLPSAEAAHFGSSAVKRKMAAAAGAIGMIRLWTPALEAQIPVEAVRGAVGRTFFVWADGSAPEGDRVRTQNGTPQVEVRATTVGEASEALFAGVEATLDDILAAADKGPVKGFDLNQRVRFQQTSKHVHEVSSRNVGALLLGSDPARASELVVITAHYDHVGFCGDKNDEDRICNGALDNAIGTASMLAVAETFAKSKERPARPVLFLAVGAEESGLIGSDYFIAHQRETAPDFEVIANINMDGAIPFYDFSDVVAFGEEQSELGLILRRAVAPMELSVRPDPFPELSIFTRSDQYSFVKRGVPSLFLWSGFANIAGKNVGSAIFGEFYTRIYHKAADDLRLPIDYAAAAKLAEAFRAVIHVTANRNGIPRWYSDSVFGALFAPDAETIPRPVKPQARAANPQQARPDQ
ncbi:MAG: M20/M25/M40 family metallo-hydrolase [Pseudomonadota bacterium]